MKFEGAFGVQYEATTDAIICGGQALPYKDIKSVSFKAPSFLTGGRIGLVRAQGPVYIVWKGKPKTEEAKAFYEHIQTQVAEAQK